MVSKAADFEPSVSTDLGSARRGGGWGVGGGVRDSLSKRNFTLFFVGGGDTGLIRPPERPASSLSTKTPSEHFHSEN